MLLSALLLAAALLLATSSSLSLHAQGSSDTDPTLLCGNWSSDVHTNGSVSWTVRPGLQLSLCDISG